MMGISRCLWGRMTRWFVSSHRGLATSSVIDSSIIGGVASMIGSTTRTNSSGPEGSAKQVTQPRFECASAFQSLNTWTGSHSAVMAAL